MKFQRGLHQGIPYIAFDKLKNVFGKQEQSVVLRIHYYQQIVTNVAIFSCSFEQYKLDTLMLDQGDHGNASWEQLNDYLVSRGLLTVLTQAASAEMERDIMYDATMSANQKAIFDQILQRISLNNNMHWIMGSAGTGKSF